MKSVRFNKVKSFGLHAKAFYSLAVLTLLLTLLSFLAPTSVSAAGISLSKSSIQLGETLVVSGTGFSPGEKLSFWLTAPGGAVFPAGYVNTNDKDGSFSNFPLNGGEGKITSGPGKWSLTSSGLNSKTTVSVEFNILMPTLRVQAINIGNTVVLAVYGGNYWYPEEKVNLWITDGAGTVLGLGYTFADRQGKIPDPTFIGFVFGGTAGAYSLTGQGVTSNQPIVTQFVANQISA